MALPARASGERGRGYDRLSAGSAGETGRRRERRERAVPAAQKRPLRASPRRPRTEAHLGIWPRGSARGRHGGRNSAGRSLRTRGPPQGRRERGRGDLRNLTPGLLTPLRPGHCPCLLPASTCAHTHTLVFTRTGKVGLAWTGNLVEPAIPPAAMGRYHPLKASRIKGNGPITEYLHKTGRCSHLDESNLRELRRGVGRRWEGLQS